MYIIKQRDKSSSEILSLQYNLCIYKNKDLKFAAEI